MACSISAIVLVMDKNLLSNTQTYASALNVKMLVAFKKFAMLVLAIAYHMFLSDLYPYFSSKFVESVW